MNLRLPNFKFQNMLFNLKGEKIFIAGSRGMVGSAIVRYLKKNYFCNELSISNLLIPNKSELDLLDLTKVENWFKENQPSIVILAAAKVGGIFANSNQPVNFLLDNLKIQNNVIESAFKFKSKRLVFLGSSCIYPKFCPQPIKEEFLLTDQLELTNQWYAIAKIAGIKLCEALRIQHGFDAISLMPTNLYGPNDNYHPQNSHVMAALLKRFWEAKKNRKSSVTCWGSGLPLREFMHVDDLARAVIFCIENWDPNSTKAPKDSCGKPTQFLNVGTGKDISIKNLAHKISKIIGYEGEIIWDKSKPDGTPKKQLDISKISELGWEPQIELDKGIKKTISLFD